MGALLFAALLAGTVNVPDTAVDFTVKSARPASVFNSLGGLAGTTIEASCLGEARFGLNVKSVPMPVLLDLLSAKLRVSFEGLDGGVLHAECSKEPDLPSPAIPGAFLADLPASVRQFYGTGEAGVLVRAVAPQSVAAAAGLHENDVITKIDGAAVKSAKDVEAILAKKSGPMQKTEFTLLRDQQPWSLAMVIVSPANQAALSEITQRMIEERNGITDAAMRGDGNKLPTMVDSNGGNNAQAMPHH